MDILYLIIIIIAFVLFSIILKIISFQELKKVTKVFGANLSIYEKQSFIGIFRFKKGLKNTSSDSDSLHMDDGSLAFFYIQRYCLS